MILNTVSLNTKNIQNDQPNIAKRYNLGSSPSTAYLSLVDWLFNTMVQTVFSNENMSEQRVILKHVGSSVIDKYSFRWWISYLTRRWMAIETKNRSIQSNLYVL